jgi:hypothetical protein
MANGRPINTADKRQVTRVHRSLADDWSSSSDDACQLVCGCRDLKALIAGAPQLVFGALTGAIASRNGGDTIRRAAGDLVLPGMAVIEAE